MLNRHLALGTFLVVILGLILLVSSCSPFQHNPTTIPLPESGGQIPSEPATEEPTTDLSYLISANPAEVDNSGLPITPVEALNITGHAQEVDIEEYRLRVDGLVENPLSLAYEDIVAYPAVTEVVLLICQGFFVDNAEWSGIPVSIILAEAGIKPEAKKVSFHALDGYTTTLDLDVAQREGVFLAHTVNGQVLPREHGYPLRLVVKGQYGSDWVKWVERIKVT